MSGRLKLPTLKSQLRTVTASRLQPLPTATVERKRGWAGVQDRDRIRARDCGLCQECRRNGKVSVGGPVDHIKPLCDGGTDEDSNKELLCVPCHDAKSAREARERAGRG